MTDLKEVGRELIRVYDIYVEVARAFIQNNLGTSNELFAVNERMIQVRITQTHLITFFSEKDFSELGESALSKLANHYKEMKIFLEVEKDKLIKVVYKKL